ncbi:MAG: sulfatase-like hydrolase/transferase [Opitutaceae bacterium]
MSARPNILWIVTTQWRAQACGYAGDVNARTSAIDGLAASSVNFIQAVTPHPFGPFARAAMLTGVRSPQNGVAGYFDSLPRDARTIARDLRDLGYETAWFGKWHLSDRDPAAPLVGEAHARIVVPEGARGGFEFWEGFESGFLLNDPWLHGTRLPEPARFSGYQSDVLCGRAAAWLRQTERPRPWFCVVSLEPPHPPYDAPASGVRPGDSAAIRLEMNVPLGGEVEARARRELAGYYAHIEATDRAIGALLAAVPADTAVIFTSVHGDMHGAHGLLRKGWPHEESIRVPLLVRAPRGRTAGTRSGKRVTLLDLPAMTRAWAEGTSWDCTREQADISMPCVVKLPHQCDRFWRGTRSARRKMIFNADGSPWLEFDLERDPFEMSNLVVQKSGDRG